MLNPNSAPEPSINWSADAPKGGKAVMNRVLKDGAAVPLFFAQTLISSLRDVGYNTTTSALCEHVDNAIQAGATEVRVFFRQTGKTGEKAARRGLWGLQADQIMAPWDWRAVRRSQGQGGSSRASAATRVCGM